jgi:hypothetical protein
MEAFLWAFSLDLSLTCVLAFRTEFRTVFNGFQRGFVVFTGRFSVSESVLIDHEIRHNLIHGIHHK